jgi:hypothetical protein
MLNPATGAANPNFHPQPNASVLRLALYGRTLYLGGKFTSVAGAVRSRLAAVDAITGGLGTRLTLAPNAAVRDLALNSTGSTLYLAGSFTRISGTTRYNFASVGTASRVLTAWNPNIHASGWGVALSPDNATAYLTTADGNESVCNAGHESVIAMPATGSGTPPVRWHNGGAPGCPFNSGDINAVEATSSAVYVGGHLTNLCTVTNTSYTARCPGALTVRNHLAALNPATGVPLSWNPGAGGTRGGAGHPGHPGWAWHRRRLPADQRRAAQPLRPVPRHRVADSSGRTTLCPDRYGAALSASPSGCCSEGSALGLVGCGDREVSLHEQPAVVAVLQDGGEATGQGKVLAIHAGQHAGPPGDPRHRASLRHHQVAHSRPTAPLPAKSPARSAP